MNGEKKQRQTNIEKESDRQTKSLEINREREREGETNRWTVRMTEDKK
jgi:hypothetical protein